MKNSIALVAIASLIAACGKPEQVSDTPAAEPADTGPTVSVYEAAVSNPSRSEGDRKRDPDRKPGQVLEFFGIAPGMQVLDMFSGGGYYTELVAYVVGPEGSVSAHTNEAYAQYVGDEALIRYGGDRLPNASIMTAENNELEVNPNAYDAVLMILSYHDIYYVDPQNGWPQIDGSALLAELYKGLKPGGILGVVDHRAEAGSSSDTGGTLHRIDPAIVIAEIQAAGFVLDGETELLANSDDDLQKDMADPEIRGKTDRFVLRFVKPE